MSFKKHCRYVRRHVIILHEIYRYVSLGQLLCFLSTPNSSSTSCIVSRSRRMVPRAQEGNTKTRGYSRVPGRVEKAQRKSIPEHQQWEEGLLYRIIPPSETRTKPNVDKLIFGPHDICNYTFLMTDDHNPSSSHVRLLYNMESPPLMP